MLQSFNNPPFSVVCPLLFAPVALASSVGLRRLWEHSPLPLIKEQSRALNVDGEVDVLREAVNQPMGLGERGAALEAEALRELLICAKDLRGPDHPDVLLKQLGRPAGFGGSHEPAAAPAPVCSAAPAPALWCRSDCAREGRNGRG
jgi:hypothetical protein